MRLELTDTQGRYLLYAPSEPPEVEQDWLLDVRLYSASFRADRASMLLSELGLAQQSLRLHLAERARFFASRDRLERLKRLVSPNDSALDIDRKIIAVLAKADQPEFFNVLIALFDSIPEGHLDALPPAWGEMEKFGVQAAFWDLAEGQFGYQGGGAVAQEPADPAPGVGPSSRLPGAASGGPQAAHAAAPGGRQCGGLPRPVARQQYPGTLL